LSEKSGQTIVSGAGGRPPSELCGRRWLYLRRQRMLRLGRIVEGYDLAEWGRTVLRPIRTPRFL